MTSTLVADRGQPDTDTQDGAAADGQPIVVSTPVQAAADQGRTNELPTSGGLPSDQPVPPDGSKVEAESPLDPIRPEGDRSAWAALYLLADLLDDYERVRIANANRLRALTDVKGVSDAIPEVQLFADGVAQLDALEHGAELALKRAMRNHPLGPWVAKTKGVGEKQAARLLAAIGDPGDRPNPAKLWAYCGLHVVQAVRPTKVATQVDDADGFPGAPKAVAQPGTAPAPGDSSAALDRHDAREYLGGGSPTNPHQEPNERASGNGADPGRTFGVAPKRRRGVRANWNSQARTRVYVIAEACIKLDGVADKNGKARARSPYRDVYDDGREKYAESVYPDGMPLTDGHKHRRAVRLVMKRILLDLWKEARRLRGEDA